ncbi:hypothetical protein HOLDEFILI_01185 [Holdemania filiformis DSM 12042]|uniref:Uncharacterized protein n=1 Tax=Holdemania filiformis DSM 12042 TaxID=545696 RepID=B9Y5V3_9FIRM|nr:hypothetical protein HOLDEFILI_01185 [Holdemania filiformis DSM 12042]
MKNEWDLTEQPDQNGKEMSYDFTGAAENPAVFILCRRMLCSN